MNLYEYEGKSLFEKYGIKVPRGILIQKGHDIQAAYTALGIEDVVIKAQVLSGKRGKNGGIAFCSSTEELEKAYEVVSHMQKQHKYVPALLIEEKLDISEEHYISFTYDTNAKQPILIYSSEGGVDIEEVEHSKIVKHCLQIENSKYNPDDGSGSRLRAREIGDVVKDQKLEAVIERLWQCFLEEDCRQVEINPLVKTKDGEWIAADAKIALDDDAFFRHDEWQEYPLRSMLGRPPTDREMMVKEIDAGENYYRGTAGKYIEMDGDIAILFSGGGASIANMDALMQEGLSPANYTEYSGNPPREKVYELAKIVLSKLGLKGLWIAGGVANFTNVEETFHGIVDALDEIKPTYPIVVRRAGPFEKEGMELMEACAKRNDLNMKLFGKDVSMSETAGVLASMLKNK